MFAAAQRTVAGITADRRRTGEWGAAGILLALVIFVTVVAFYPGSLNYDSEQTINQARLGHFSDWWTPMGAVALRGWFALGLGVGAVYVMEVFLFTTSVFALTRQALSPLWAALATAVIVLWPPTSALLSTLTRDIFFFAFAMFTLAALGKAYRVPSPDRRRRAYWVAGALVLAFVSVLIRQNGIVMVFVVAGAGFALLRRPATGEVRSLVRRIAPVVGAAVAAGVICLVAVSTINRVVGVDKAYPELMLYQYDLAAMSTDLDENQFSDSWVSQRRGWKVPVYSQPWLERHFEMRNVLSIFPLFSEWRPEFKEDPKATPKRESSRLRAMWIDAVTTHPISYLKVRLRVNLSSLGFYERPLDAYPFVVDEVGPIRQAPQVPPPKFTNRNRQARSALGKFVGGNSWIPLDIAAVYLALGLGVSVYLGRRSRANRGLISSIVMVELLTVAVLLVTTMASSYRYLALITPLSMILAIWGIAQYLSDRKARIA